MDGTQGPFRLVAIDCCDNSRLLLTYRQVTCITTILKRNNQPIRDRNRFLPHRSRPHQKPHHFSHRIHYRRSRPRHTLRKGLELGVDSQDLIIIPTKVRFGEVSGVEKHTKTADLEGQRTDQNRSMLYPDVSLGYW